MIATTPAPIQIQVSLESPDVPSAVCTGLATRESAGAAGSAAAEAVEATRRLAATREVMIDRMCIPFVWIFSEPTWAARRIGDNPHIAANLSSGSATPFRGRVVVRLGKKGAPRGAGGICGAPPINRSRPPPDAPRCRRSRKGLVGFIVPGTSLPPCSMLKAPCRNLDRLADWSR